MGQAPSKPNISTDSEQQWTTCDTGSGGASLSRLDSRSASLENPAELAHQLKPRPECFRRHADSESGPPAGLGHHGTDFQVSWPTRPDIWNPQKV